MTSTHHNQSIQQQRTLENGDNSHRQNSCVLDMQVQDNETDSSVTTQKRDDVEDEVVLQAD